jgi:hypothetical protein
MTSISTSVRSSSFVKGNPHIMEQLLGNRPINEKNITSFQEYDDIYRIRHDLIHSIVCDKLSLPFGERKVSEVLCDLKDVSLKQYYDDVKDQTPDYLGINGKNVKMIEVSISVDLRSKKTKHTKYALLIYFLKTLKLEVDYKVIIFNPRNIYVNRDELIRDGMDDLVIDLAKKICDNCSNLLMAIHRTDVGQHYYRTRMDISETKIDFPFDMSLVFDTHNSHANKCFHNSSDLEFKSTTDHITTEDNEFIDYCVSKLDSVISTIENKEDTFIEEEFMKEMESKSNSNSLKSFFPLPLIRLKETDSATRSTQHDWSHISLICAKMIQSNDSIMVKFADHCSKNLHDIRRKQKITNEDFLFICKFDQLEREEIALNGPGRKTYVKKHSVKHVQESQKYDGYAMNPNLDVSELLDLTLFLSQKDNISSTGNLEIDMEKLSKLNGPGLEYVRICQSIYREININSMRGDRRHKHIIKPTGVIGVFILLYQGTKLRCGELANIIWFKLIIDNEQIVDSPFDTHWSFKKLTRDNKVSYSEWLSCDVHRLDHYIRCFDKILMAYTSMISQRYKTTMELEVRKGNTGEMKETIDEPSNYNLINQINIDDTNTLGLIIAIYLEDKRSTSKMLQNVRYLIMTSISIYPKIKSSMDKFKDAIRSPLQLFCLKNCLKYISKMKNWSVKDSVKFGNVKYDYQTHTFLDSHGGVNIRLPRPLIHSSRGYGEFSEILCEMYFTMLFNKNQDDPTHASFQILDKIIEGEENFQSVKRENNHLGYLPDIKDEEFVDVILSKKKSHMFSRRAIEIGSKLLRLINDDPNGDRILECVLKKNVDKTLDEFATYKSSATFENEIYNPEKNKQNNRTRCIEQILDQREGLYKSFEVAQKYKCEETFYHVFKKNQIGGVREILILPMTVRIRINILETISRNICKLDKREVLTHGAVKYDSIKAALYTSKKYEGNRVPVHITMDKSKWGPSFVPIQFIYLFTPFKKQMGGLFNFILDLLIRHQNKFCVLPDRLVKAWSNHKYDRTHHYQGLQNLKNEFIKTSSLKYKNESNMGQGILHFTSSLSHLCMITFRDELYKRKCKELNMDPNDHEDLLSSDDSYTIFCPEVKKTNIASYFSMKLSLFLRCQQLSEYLFNCRSSLVKSSINPLIGEFNSLFIGNMTFIPTLMKFALSSVHPPNTDSFYRLVKECFSSSRQILENGGALDLFYLSHLLNKRYSESIYHSSHGGVNDLSKYDITHVPYHLGKYPLFNPALMAIFGPDYYNYNMFKTQWNHMNDKEKRLFSSSHKLIKGGVIETMAEFEDGDTVLGGLMRIEASIGPIRQHERIKKHSILDKDEISKKLSEDPLLIIKRPKTLEDVIFRTCQKIFTTGAKEAVKNIAASIYYGRVSATVSAEVFYIPNGSIEKKTYLDCLNHMISAETKIENMEEQLRFLYPKYIDYDVFINNDSYNLDFKIRDPFEIQTVQTLVTHRIFTKLTQSVSELLEYKWKNKEKPEHLESKINRDFEIIKLHYPMIKDTIEETLDQFSGSREDKTKAVLLLVLKLFSLRERVFKGVIHGFGSNDLTRSYETLIERNYSAATSTIITSDTYSKINYYVDYDKLYQAYNYDILCKISNKETKENIWNDVNEDDLNIFLQDPGINRNVKKRVFMSAITNGFISNIEEWSRRVGLIMHVWYTKQQYKKGDYSGDFELCLFIGGKRLYCYYSQERDHYHFRKLNIEDPSLLWEMFRELSELISKDINEITKKSDRGYWVVEKDKIMKSMGGGFEIKESIVNYNIDFSYCYLEVDDKWIKLMDQYGFKIFSIETGLLNSNYHDESIKTEFFGLKFSTICKIGAMNSGFSVLYKSQTETLELLEDLIVEKPLISDQTKARLNLKDWDTYITEDVGDINIHDGSFFEDLMNVDLSFMEADIRGELLSGDVDKQTAEFVLFMLNTDGIYSLKTEAKIQQTRKLYIKIKSLKYDLIASHFLLDMKINKRIISSIGNLLKNGVRKYILFSLISVYDRTYQIDGQTSPNNVVMNINQEIVLKFKIRTKEEEEEIIIF